MHPKDIFNNKIYQFKSYIIINLMFSGLHCNIPNMSSAFATLNLTFEQVIAISAAILLLILIIIIACIIRCCCIKRRRNRARINNQTRKEPPNMYLNSNRNHEMTELKRGSKMSNLEVNRVRKN